MVAPWNLLFPQRARMNWHLRRWGFFAHLRLFRRLGYGLESIALPTPDPWRMPLSLFNLDPAEQRRFGMKPRDDRYLMASYREFGVFDPSAYSPDAYGLRGLVRITREIRSRGGELIIVRLPVESTLREAIPPKAQRSLTVVWSVPSGRTRLRRSTSPRRSPTTGSTISST